MRATFRNLLEAKRREREEETGEAGFSLIELIIVVVILGILVAIAIPLVGSLQSNAEKSADQAAAANAATQVAAQITNGGTATAPAAGNSNITIAFAGGTVPSTVDAICVTASSTHWVAQTGPGCATTVTAAK